MNNVARIASKGVQVVEVDGTWFVGVELSTGLKQKSFAEKFDAEMFRITLEHAIEDAVHTTASLVFMVAG